MWISVRSPGWWIPGRHGGTIDGMRWMDLPGGRGPADDGDSLVLRRGDWEDLRRRLERLPAGHPSSPRGDDGVDGDGADGDGADGDGAEEAGSSPEPAEAQDREVGRSEDRDAGERGQERRTRAAGRGGPDGRAGRGGHDAAADGQREPYRPWFTSGESPEPWFYANPGV